MSQTIDITVSGIVAIITGIFGSKVATLLSDAVVDAVNVPAPSWVTNLTGPAGALVGLAIGLVWMNNRLNRAEAKNDARDVERDEDRKNLITVIQQNSHILEDVKDHLSKRRNP